MKKKVDSLKIENTVSYVANVKKETRTVEWICFSLFIILSIVLCYLHEPWYDEIQAWMLAKDASLHDILWVLPHYEGHPPLWHLLLAIFAKAGLSMEIGMRIVSLTFSFAACYLVMFKAPFHKIIRVLIPFTYYFFYQYTVTNRPYSIMMFAMLLAAYFYSTRKEKPVRYTAALFLMCLSSAYGIVIAGSICLVWLIEIIMDLKGKEFLKKLVHDKRAYSLLGILILTLLLAVIIFPASDAFARVRASDFSRIKCLIYMFLLAPGDSLCTDIGIGGRLQQYDFMITTEYTVIMCGAVSVILTAAIILFAKIYKKTALFVIPYTILALFGALVYFYYHHNGLIALFILFFFWCAYTEKPEKIVFPGWVDKVDKANPGLVKKVCIFFVAICILVPLFWNVMASYNDVTKDVWYAKNLADFIDEYELDQYKVASQWTYDLTEEAMNRMQENVDGKILQNADGLVTDENDTETMQELMGTGVTQSETDAQKDINNFQNMLAVSQLDPHDYEQYVKMCNFVDILVYFDHNFIYNYNDGDDHNRYVNHDTLTDEETYAELERLGSMGYPEVIIGSPEILGLMGLDANKNRYYEVYRFTCFRINKYNAEYARSFVYVNEDIYKSRNDWPNVAQAKMTK